MIDLYLKEMTMIEEFKMILARRLKKMKAR